MPRLIDADALIERLKPYINKYGGESFPYDIVHDAFIHEIEHASTVDAVPVVRCKYCKWYGDNWVSRMGKVCMNSRLKTGYGTLWVEDDFYCGYGEEHE